MAVSKCNKPIQNHFINNFLFAVLSPQHNSAKC